DSAVRKAVEDEAVGLFRFASAALGAADEAEALVQAAIAAADAAHAGGDGDALSRARLFAAVRKGAAQRIEQQRRTAGAATLAPHALVEKVRPTEREALVMRYVAALSVDDVAAACGVDRATTLARLSRGLGAVAAAARVQGGATPAAPVNERRRAVE